MRFHCLIYEDKGGRGRLTAVRVHSCSSVSLSVYRIPLTDFREIWHLGTYMKIRSENPNLVKIGQIIGHFTWRPKCVSLLSATLNRHKDAAFKWNGIRLLAYPWRYKHYANAPHISTMPTLSSLHISESLMVYVFYYKCLSQLSGHNVQLGHAQRPRFFAASVFPLIAPRPLDATICLMQRTFLFFRLLTLIWLSCCKLWSQLAATCVIRTSNHCVTISCIYSFSYSKNFPLKYLKTGRRPFANHIFDPQLN